MQTIRKFEERVLQLSRGDAPEIVGSVHLCGGQEAIPVGALAALNADDRVVATYRGHGWALESGITADELMAELCHREAGINGGRAGSAYVMAPQRRFFGENSIVGAGGPIACGTALAAQAGETGRVTIVSFGDGAMSQGALHEAFVFAAARQLPVIFVCENNGWSELTPTSKIARIERLGRRSLGYGIAGVTIDGCDPVAVRDAVAQAAERARKGDGPTLIECKTVRLWGHYNRDIEHYRPLSDKKDAAAREPVAAACAKLLGAGLCTEADLNVINTEIAAEIDAVVERSIALPGPDPATARDHIYGSRASTMSVAGEMHEEQLTTIQAINRALRDELTSNPKTLVYGEDVGHAGGIFGASRDLQKEFGATRVFDTPIAESAILGSAVGAAIEGMRPIVEIMWSDFLLVALDSIVNQAANVRYLTRGEFGASLVMRTQQGTTPGSCAQHSQCLEALLAHIPGLKVGLPSTPQDAYSMLRAAAHDPDPCMLFEARALYQTAGTVTLSGPVEPALGAKVRREGKDLVIITWGTMVQQALAAASALSDRGHDVAVLDLRWLNPLDEEAIASAVKACGRVLVVHEANQTMGFGAEVAARIAEQLGAHLKAPVRRLGARDTRIPASPALQAALLPNADAIVSAALPLLNV
ncbi:MAG: transketolase [Betaproteobacteria bacterium]|nr:transketolase [Betaproteobacteria bacterium]